MSPSLSCAALPIQRNLESLGANVPDWNMAGAAASGLRSSYQRTPVKLPAVTLCVTTSDSCAPPGAVLGKLRYASRYIRRSPSESSFAPPEGCLMQFVPPHASVNDGTLVTFTPVVPPLNVEFAGFAQSTWNLNIRIDGLPPADGTSRPSR